MLQKLKKNLRWPPPLDFSKTKNTSRNQKMVENHGFSFFPTYSSFTSNNQNLLSGLPNEK